MLVVGQKEISAHAINREIQYHPGPTLAQARLEATRALVVRSLLEVRARQLGILPQESPSERELEEAIRQLTEREVPVPKVQQQEVHAYYETNRAKFTVPSLYEPAHILFALPQHSEGRNLVRDKAERTLAEVLEHPQRFERLAREFSGCPSASNGGRLGQTSPGETLPEFERAATAIEPGQICTNLVETRHGLHIVRLDNKAEGDVLPLEAVQERILLFLRDGAWRRSLHAYIRQTADDVGVEGFDIEQLEPVESDADPVEPQAPKKRRLRVLA